MTPRWRDTWFTDGATDAPPHDGVYVDEGYLVGRILHELPTDEDTAAAWKWWMIATSRFGAIDEACGTVSTEFEAKQAVTRAYAVFFEIDGAREDFFAMTAAIDMSPGSWRT